ncbi:hypothetical protein CRE_31278 [Caenorhabditis remanei]|uniref:Uncharacterized protein n=2 Tax=Caenorhabditis remanei TaxID=31234 RepID=E3MLL8_CAERE|nr:hypothetical protein CRE_31278 [Caenorhabditis remanei]
MLEFLSRRSFTLKELKRLVVVGKTPHVQFGDPMRVSIHEVSPNGYLDGIKSAVKQVANADVHIFIVMMSMTTRLAMVL